MEISFSKRSATPQRSLLLPICRRRAGQSGYMGEIFGGMRHGEGKLQLSNGVSYVGQWVFNEMHGRGEISWPDGKRYSGQWETGRMNGHGVLTAGPGVAGGANYDGQWTKGCFHEWGVLSFPDGTSYEGKWRNGREHGRGCLSLPDGKVYDGYWIRGHANGHGVLTYPDGRKRYEGQFKHDRPHGRGQLTYEDGVQYVGQWQNGEPAGAGKWRDVDGQWLLRADAPLGHEDLPTPMSSTRGVCMLSGMPRSDSDSHLSGTTLDELVSCRDELEDYRNDCDSCQESKLPRPKNAQRGLLKENSHLQSVGETPETEVEEDVVADAEAEINPEAFESDDEAVAYPVEAEATNAEIQAREERGQDGTSRSTQSTWRVRRRREFEALDDELSRQCDSDRRNVGIDDVQQVSPGLPSNVD
eukprot:TRINITY_DN44516_c0_g1_i1.p1 TRINITY_DN44516_c0_g1~~TRINITY_DN44516_c0_g1_i1.p1  ORF type:complete len:414 (-),score=63.26 TRINITY_DN44516_c0_g1_i1:25-1266(-)